MTPRLSIIAASIRKALGGLAGDIGKYADEYWSSVVLSLRGNTPVQDFKTETVLNMHMDGADADWGSVVLGMHMGGGEVDPYWSNVSLLMLMNGTNASTAIGDVTGKTITVAGNAQISTTQSKFGGSSCYFDGTFSKLTGTLSSAIGTEDVTVELWYNPGAIDLQVLVDFRAADDASGFSIDLGNSVSGKLNIYTAAAARVIGSTTLVTGTWYHVAAVRTSGKLRLYVNGVEEGTAYSDTANYTSTSLTIGNYIGSTVNTANVQGYIDNLRITKGVARYTDRFTPPNREFPAGATTIYDVKGHPVISYGNTSIVAMQSRFGGYSCYFDGTGDYLQIPYTSEFSFGAGSFTIELWFYVAANVTSNKHLVARWVSGGSQLCWDIGLSNNNTIFYQVSTSGAYQAGNSIVSSANAFASGVWNHLAFVRNGDVFNLYINGISVATHSPGAITLIAGTTPVFVGIDGDGAGPFTGYIDDLRITKGVARYTAAFTPPSRAFPHDVAFYDEKGLVPTLTGTPTVSTGTLKYGYGSASFNGTTDYLTFDARSDFGLTAGDFTLEAWVKTSVAGTLLDFRNYASDYGHFYIATGGYLAFDHTYGAIVGTTTVTDNNWHHVAFVRYNNILTLYVDGADSGAAIANANIGSNRQARIGATVDGTNFFAGNVDQLRLTKVARYVGEFTPQKYLFEDANNNVIWRDETGINTVTANGNATISSAAYKYGNGSMCFDGTGDYLSVPSTTDLAFGTSDYTVEGWVYLSALGTERALLDTRAATTDTGLYLSISATNFPTLFGNNAAIVTGSSALSATTWYHLAAVKSSGTVTLYLNGTSIGSAANAYSVTCPGSVVIGRKIGSTSNDWSGYLDDLRITKGIARYVSSFTPPVRQNANYGLPAVPTPVKTHLDPHYDSVVLNMHMNGPSGSAAFLDEKGKVVTAAGNAALSSTQSKFGGVSAYFDGTGDYLSVPTSSGSFSFAAGEDFTVEAWVYLTTTPTSFFAVVETRGNVGFNPWTFGIYNSGGLKLDAVYSGARLTGASIVGINQWVHIAMTRSSSVLRFFINGVVDANTATVATAISASGSVLYVGAIIDPDYAMGYIDDLRITKGVARYTNTFTVPALPNPDYKTAPAATDPYWKNVVLHMPMNGADAGTTFTENTGKVITVTGNTSTQVEQYRFGGSSAYFDGTGDCLTIPYSTSLAIANGEDYTIECWVLSNVTADKGIFALTSSTTNDGYAQVRVGIGASGKFHMLLAQGGSTSWQTESPSIFEGSSSYTVNTWYHLAFVKSGTSYTTYINGASVISYTGPTTPYQSGGVSIIGAIDNSPSTAPFSGYIDDLRITKGVARYTANFTPPSLPNPTGYDPYAPNVVLHLPMNTDFTDGTGKTVTVSGNTVISTTVKKYGAGSGYFDGAGDYLTLDGSSGLAFDTGDFTIEFWFRSESLASAAVIFDWRDVNGFYPYLDISTSGILGYYVNNAYRITGTAALKTGAWYHISVCRASGVTKLFVNGTQDGSSWTDSTALSVGASRPAIFSNGITLGTFCVNGYIDDLRITKGIARYTATFTPPREPFYLG